MAAGPSFISATTRDSPGQGLGLGIKPLWLRSCKLSPTQSTTLASDRRAARRLDLLLCYRCFETLSELNISGNFYSLISSGAGCPLLSWVPLAVLGAPGGARPSHCGGSSCWGARAPAHTGFSLAMLGFEAVTPGCSVACGSLLADRGPNLSLWHW